MKNLILVLTLSILLVGFAAAFYLWAGKNASTPGSQTNETTTVENAPEEAGIGPSVYEDYSEESLNLAIESDRVVLLYFTANWCEPCQAQETVNANVLGGLTNEGVVGLRVHVLDSEATNMTEALAKKYDVASENSMVIINTNRGVEYKYAGGVGEEELMQRLQQAMEVE